MRVWDLDERVQVAELYGHKYGIVCVVRIYSSSALLVFSVVYLVYTHGLYWTMLLPNMVYARMPWQSGPR